MKSTTDIIAMEHTGVMISRASHLASPGHQLQPSVGDPDQEMVIVPSKGSAAARFTL